MFSICTVHSFGGDILVATTPITSLSAAIATLVIAALSENILGVYFEELNKYWKCEMSLNRSIILSVLGEGISSHHPFCWE